MPELSWTQTPRELADLCIAAGSIEAGARQLGVHPTTLRNKLKREELFEEVRASTGRAPRAAAVPQGEVNREEVLEAEVRELRAAASKERRGDVHAERVHGAIAGALDRVQPVPYAADYEPPEPTEGAHHSAVLVLSDFHGGECVDQDVLNGLNDYSWAIMEERVAEVLQAVRSHLRYAPALRKLYIAFVGDMCSGENHLELAVTNDFPLAEQGVRMGEVQARIVRALAEVAPEVQVECVEGNHPRLSMKPAAKHPHNNMDWLANILASQLVAELPNVEYNIGRGSSIFEVAGRRIYLWHGDGIRSSMPGVPWGGVMRRVNALEVQHRQRRIDHFILGHFHQANVVQGGRIIMNGSLKGLDEWCLKQFGQGEVPTQLLLFFDERRQRMTDVKYLTPTAGLS